MKGFPTRFDGAAVGGFTLLELVVALLVVSIMMTLLFNGLRLGVRTWDSVEERTRTLHEAHLAQLFIKRQLEQAQPIAFTKAGAKPRISFLGERHAIRFVAPLPAHIGPGGMYWFTIDVADGEQAKQLVLSYELFQTEAWERYTPQQAEKVVLIDDLGDAEFAYRATARSGSQPRWTTRWGREDQLPHLVRLRLRSDGAATSQWEELVVAPKVNNIAKRGAGNTQETDSPLIESE